MRTSRYAEPPFVASRATLASYGPNTPRLHPGVVLMDGVRVVGDVEIGVASSVWYNSVIRGDVHSVRIGGETNIQDNSVLHVTHDRFPLTIGSRVTVGHAARLHGCTIEDECLIGIGAVVLDGCTIERRAIVAAGAVVPPGTVVKSGTVVAGVPARVTRPLSEEEIADLPEGALRYVAYALRHRTELAGAPAPRRFRATTS